MAPERMKVMVVDDEFDILTIVRKFLENCEYDNTELEVDTFSNPLHAYEVFKSNPARYSLVLVDVRMPEISGISLAVMLRKVRRDIKILVTTAYEIGIKEIQSGTPELKPLEILHKPFHYEEICNAVKRQLKIRA